MICAATGNVAAHFFVHIHAPLAAARHSPSKLVLCARLAQTFIFKDHLLAKLTDFPTNIFSYALAGKPFSSTTICKIVFTIRKIVFIISKIIFPLIYDIFYYKLCNMYYKLANVRY